MPDSSVASRYAVAMIEVAEESGVIEQVGKDLANFTAMVEAHDGMLLAAFSNPSIRKKERHAVLEDLLPRLNAHHLTGNFLRLVNEKNRLGITSHITTAYHDLAYDLAGRIKVIVETAEPMSPPVEAEVQEALARTTGKRVILRTVVDPALIGGLVARIGGKVYDSSIRTRLENIRQVLIRSQVPGQA